MDEPRFYQRSWFYFTIWTIIWGGIYLWQIRRLGGFQQSLVYMFVDAILFLLGLLIWLAFFAQFVLPVRTFRERQKIFDRLLSHLLGAHGPAIFIRNGRLVKEIEEEKKKGAGVLWLDTASAAVTRTSTAFKQTIGPGVHFIDNGETLAGTVDLHTQVQLLGPREKEDPFAKQKEGQSDEAYKAIQDRRMEVRAWTRDGIEIVPNLVVVFKIDADPVSNPTAPGSRFGYNEESVRKAVTGEGINPNHLPTDQKHRLAWNRLPAMVAVDLWREYLAKVTLEDLFEVGQDISSSDRNEILPTSEDTMALAHPVVPSKNAFEKAVVGILKELNRIVSGWVDDCETKYKGKMSETEVERTAFKQKVKLAGSGSHEEKVTGLRFIIDSINKRMKQESYENQLLRGRGVRIYAVSVSNLRFKHDVEEQLVRRWSAIWLEEAKANRERVDRLRAVKQINGQVESVYEYSTSLSTALLKGIPTKKDLENLIKYDYEKLVKNTVKKLVLSTRDELIKDDRLRQRTSMEREELEEIIQWVERNGL